MYYAKFYERVVLSSGQIIPPGRWTMPVRPPHEIWVTLADRSVRLTKQDWYLENLLGSVGPVWWIETAAEAQELDR